MNKSLLIIFATVTLDAVGIGLIMPITPQLLREVGHVTDISWQYGAFLSLYALMQFIFSPILGALSDRFGRRPVLLVSLAGAAIDYAVMGLTPSLWLLYVGRAVSGITGASMAVSGAYISDITPEDQRARRFGQLGACFGVGFIAGPLLGGFLGETWVRAPFYAAALLNGINMVFAWFFLPESHQGKKTGGGADAFNPLAPLRWVLGFKVLLPMVLTFVIIALVGQVGGTVWMLYGEDKFAWDKITMGVSLAGFGFFHAVAQAFIAGPVAERWGNKAALVVGIVCDGAAYVLMALATSGWMAFALMPLFCLGGLGAPALQSLMTSHVGDDRQGELQGVLASLTSLASIFGPLLISGLYFASRGTFPGLVWIVGASLYLLCLPVLLGNGISQKPGEEKADSPYPT